MKKSFLSRFALIIAVLSVAAFGTLSTHDAFAASTSKTHHAKKHTGKKSHKKAVKSSKAKSTFLKAPAATATGHPRQIMGTPDPNVDEPSEMITEIKNRAQDQFWAGKRPYPQQVRDRMTPPAPVLTGAIAQNELQKRANDSGGNNITGMRSETLRRVSYSDLSGVTFDDQPLRMNASEAFRRSLDTVSFELGRPCKSQEYFGWPMQQNEQGRVDRIFEETNAKFKLRGYNLQPRKPRSVGSDVAAFTADRQSKRILGIWSAGDVGLLLLMCDSDAPAPVATTAKSKRDAAIKKKSKKSKKKSAKSVTSTSETLSEAGEPVPSAKPQVIPGAASKTLPPEPAQSTPAIAPTPEPVAVPPPAPEPTPSPVSPLVPTSEPAPSPAPVTTPVPTPPIAPEPTAPKVETPPPAPAINPTNAFIPADAPPPAPKSADPVAPDVAR